MTKRHRPKPQPAPQPVIMQVPNFDPPVPVQPGDQVTFSRTEYGLRVSKIERSGVQVWPEVKAA